MTGVRPLGQEPRTALQRPDSRRGFVAGTLKGEPVK